MAVMNRRGFRGTAVLTVDLPLALTPGLLKPARVLAEWPADAFHATNLDVALGRPLQKSKLEPAEAITVDVPDIAEDGSQVALRVRSRTLNASSITLLSEKNPNQVVARAETGPRLDPFVNTRIRMGASAKLFAVANVDGKYFVAIRRVEVTRGRLFEL